MRKARLRLRAYAYISFGLSLPTTTHAYASTRLSLHTPTVRHTYDQTRLQPYTHTTTHSCDDASRLRLPTPTIKPMPTYADRGLGLFTPTLSSRLVAHGGGDYKAG